MRSFRPSAPVRLVRVVEDASHQPLPNADVIHLDGWCALARVAYVRPDVTTRARTR